MTDLVYVLRPGLNEELRYSLRSMAANVAHVQVWTVGPEQPDWLSPTVRHIRTTEGARASKWKQIPAAIAAACEQFEVAEDFILCNDDFYVMEPWTPVPMHRGTLDEYKNRADTYGTGYQETAAYLRMLGVEGPLFNYELHVPFPVEKSKMCSALGDALDMFRGRCLHARTLYGNLWHVGGEPAEDVKVHGPEGARYLRGRQLISTNDTSFGGYPVGRYIRSRFPDASKYERTARG